MLNSVSYSCTALSGMNKVGKIKQEADGYYKVILGGLNVFNSSGQLYPYEPAKQLFETSGVLQRRIKRGALRAENGHPKKTGNMSNADYVSRLLNIYEGRVCAHIKQIDLDFNAVKDDKGRPIVAIVGHVAPAGELGYVLEKALQNPNENVAFSIRAFTDDRDTYTGTIRILKNIVTWDYVGEPGIAVAEKYYSPTLESLDFQTFSRGDMERAVRDMNKTSVATESAKMNAQELFQTLGWVDQNAQPSFMQW